MNAYLNPRNGASLTYILLMLQLIAQVYFKKMNNLRKPLKYSFFKQVFQ